MVKKKDAVLQTAIDKINKDFGAGSVMSLGDAADMEVEAFSTGSFKLDMALGVGGLPRGRVVEISGTESSGKTTLGLHVVASAQKIGDICAYIDVEHALDPVYAKAIGVNIDDLLISQPNTAEQALEIARQLCATGKVGVIVLDSVAALVPRRELEGEIGDSHIGLMARIMSQTLRVMVGDIYKTGTTMIFINQIREKVGVMFGSNEVTPGGRALKFYSSVRLDVRRVETNKIDGEATSNTTKVRVIKNKVAPPFREARFQIEFGTGISFVGEVIDSALDVGIMKKSGAWYKYGDDEQFVIQGFEAAKVALKADDKLLDEIYKKTWAALNGGELPI